MNLRSTPIGEYLSPLEKIIKTLIYLCILLKICMYNFCDLRMYMIFTNTCIHIFSIKILIFKIFIQLQNLNHPTGCQKHSYRVSETLYSCFQITKIIYIHIDHISKFVLKNIHNQAYFQYFENCERTRQVNCDEDSEF